MRAWITALLNSILPRHPRAERALHVSPEELAFIFEPKTVRAPWIHTLFPYRDEHVRSIIQAVKYYGESAAVELVAPFAADYLLELIDHLRRFEGWRTVTLVPIPTSQKRLRQRGYNQAALFAHALSTRIPDATIADTLLTRVERVSQVHVPRSMRKQNIKNAFTATHAAQNSYCILIDDVVESGATLSDARRALLDAGARAVIALAIAH